MYGMPYKLVGNALAYAVTHHAGQFRKNNVTPYIVHPIGVADIVYKNGEGAFLPADLEIMILAALFHDILEDCTDEETSKADLEHEMRKRWGDEVVEVVIGLTNTSKQDQPELNRAQRKAADAARLANESLAVQFVKLADILYNVNDLDSFTPGFARKFLNEKRTQVEVMTANWVEDNDDIAPIEAWNLREKCLKAIERQLEALR